MLELPPNRRTHATTMTRRRGLNWKRSAGLRPVLPHLRRVRHREADNHPAEGQRRRLVLVHPVPP